MLRATHAGARSHSRSDRHTPPRAPSRTCRASSSRRASARCSSGTTSTSTAAWPCSSASCSSRRATSARRCSRAWPRSAPASACGRSARSCSGASATGRPQVHVPRHASLTMGLSTALIGFLPTYASDRARRADPARRRCGSLQGLALGGEYGGAATYVAEHVPDDRRGYYTSFIQTTATLGFFLSLGVIGATPDLLGAEAFTAWGWRVPFLLSFVLLGGVALHPAEDARVAAVREAEGRRARSRGTRSRRASATARNLQVRAARAVRRDRGAGRGLVHGAVLRADVPAEAAQARLEARLRRSSSIALALGTPFFIVFGALSDRIGRKKIMLAGCAAGRAHLRADLHGDQGSSRTRAWLPRVDRAAARRMRRLMRCCSLQMIYVTMVYGPIAAFLVELFPTRSATPRCRCRITSATAGSAGSCR